MSSSYAETPASQLRGVSSPHSNCQITNYVLGGVLAFIILVAVILLVTGNLHFGKVEPATLKAISEPGPPPPPVTPTSIATWFVSHPNQPVTLSLPDKPVSYRIAYTGPSEGMPTMSVQASTYTAPDLKTKLSGFTNNYSVNPTTRSTTSYLTVDAPELTPTALNYSTSTVSSSSDGLGVTVGRLNPTGQPARIGVYTGLGVHRWNNRDQQVDSLPPLPATDISAPR